jgi:hypothetical protein
MARAYKLARTFWGSVREGFDVLVDSLCDLTGIHSIG